MPIYLVDLNDGHGDGRGLVEAQAPSPEAARDDVMRMLAEAAKAGIVGGGDQLPVATLRDGAGKELYRVMLALTCSQRGGDAPHEGAA